MTPLDSELHGAMYYDHRLWIEGVVHDAEMNRLRSVVADLQDRVGQLERQQLRETRLMLGHDPGAP